MRDKNTPKIHYLLRLLLPAPEEFVRHIVALMLVEFIKLLLHLLNLMT